MSTLKQLRCRYAHHQWKLRAPFFDAVVNEDWHKSTDRFLKCKLARPVKPRGRAYDRLIQIENNYRQKRLYNHGKTIDRQGIKSILRGAAASDNLANSASTAG